MKGRTSRGGGGVVHDQVPPPSEAFTLHNSELHNQLVSGLCEAGISDTAARRETRTRCASVFCVQVG